MENSRVETQWGAGISEYNVVFFKFKCFTEKLDWEI
jgi:hypothetical protein